jgi:hypothetical protein
MYVCMRDGPKDPALALRPSMIYQSALQLFLMQFSSVERLYMTLYMGHPNGVVNITFSLHLFTDSTIQNNTKYGNNEGPNY